MGQGEDTAVKEKKDKNKHNFSSQWATEALCRGMRRSLRAENLILLSCTFLHGVGVLLRFSRQPDSHCSLLCHILAAEHRV